MRYWDKARQAGKGTRLLVQYIAQIVQAGQAFKRGEYRRALEAATRASAAAQDMTTAINELIGGGFSADDNALVAQGQRVLGQLHYALGNFTEAIPLLEQSIDVQRKMGKDSGPEYAKALSALALLYVAMGTHERAIDLLQQALRAMEAAVQQTSQVFGRLGGLSDIMMDVDWGVATTRNNLAMTYAAIGDHTKALDLLRQAQETYQATGGTQHQDYARTLNNIGAIHAFLGDTQAAGSAFSEATEIYKSVGLVDHPDCAQLMGNWAELLRRSGEYVMAMSLSTVALTSLIRSVGVGHPAVADQALILARTATVTGAPEAAMKSLEAAEIINDQMMGQVFAAGSEAQRKDFVAQIRLFFATFLSVIQRHPGVPSAAQSGMGLVLKRKGILAEALAVQRDAVLYGRHPALEPTLREWQSLRVRIGGKTLSGPGPEGLDRHRQILAEWQAQMDRLEATLARQIPEMNLAQRLRTVDRQAVAAALPAGSVLVEFARVPIFDFAALPARGDPEWAPDRYLAFIMAAGEPDGVQMVDLGEVHPIDRQIAAFRAAITGEDADRGASPGREGGPSVTETDEPDQRAGILRAATHLASILPEPSAATGLDEGRALRALVFDPLLTAIGGHTRLFLAPDGDLARLPFEVLPLEDDRFLIDAYHISYLGAGRDIVRYVTASDRQAAPAMIVADPDYDLTSETKSRPASGVPFRRLIGARLEAATVASLLHVEPLVDTEAVEATLKRCRSPRILHVATHGFFLPDSPDYPVSEPPMTMLGSVAASALGRLAGRRLENPLLRWGLALAGANSWLSGEALPLPAEDGMLTGEDVTGLDLLDTELVVLSACETGLGDVHVGEGVIGLRRASVTAGARTPIMSLWKVPDFQTHDFIRGFYEGLLAGRPRADALRDAQLAMKSLYPNPHYWGAFICQGDPGPLS